MVNKRKYPNCSSTNHAKILWGLPADMRSIEGALEKKEIVLDGINGTVIFEINKIKNHKLDHNRCCFDGIHNMHIWNS